MCARTFFWSFLFAVGKTFDDEQRTSKFGLVFDIVYSMYTTHLLALSLSHSPASFAYSASERFKKIARLFKKNSKWKSFKANFYVELTIFLHVHNLHIINIFCSLFLPSLSARFLSLNVLRWMYVHVCWFHSCPFTATLFVLSFSSSLLPNCFFKLKRLNFFSAFLLHFLFLLPYFLHLTF